MPSVRARSPAGMLAVALAACGDSSTPLGSGSHLRVDVDASSMPAAGDMPSEDASADSPFAPLDGSYGVLPDGYAPLAVCSQCACAPGTYCYGGSPYSSFSGVCDQTASAGANAIATLAVGCHAIPAGCAAEPDCVCLLQALAQGMSCYPVCVDNASGGFAVYCPR